MSKTPPNIVWITLESVRADHTSLHDYHRDTTPELCRIADSDQGLSFENCFSHGTFTASSSASMLTGTYASRHGVGLSNEVLPSTLDTVAGLLSDQGYYTFALNNNTQLGPERGLNRGFDEYVFFDAQTLHRDFGLRTLLKYALNVRSHGGGLSPNKKHHGAGFMMTDSTKRRIQSFVHSEEPFFYYMHYPDTHHPYTPPLPYLREMVEDIPVSAKEARKTSLRVSNNLYELIANGCDLSTKDLNAIQAAYDAEIKHMDWCVGEIFEFIKSLTSDRDTIFIIVSDHGELFGEMGLLAHKLIPHDELTHIPMVTHGLQGIKHQTKNIVQPIDFVRTILDLVNADVSQLQGVNLQKDKRTVAVSERGGKNARRQLDRFQTHNPNFDVSKFHRTWVRSFRTHDYRYIRSRNRVELFDINSEREDISDEIPSKVEEFENIAQNWIDDYADLIEGDGERLSNDAKQKLEAMGYLT